jgi:hypothetical protein
MIDRELLEELIDELLSDARQARANGRNGKAHGLDEAASRIAKLLESH